ncbi:hypothetical protein T4C_10015 [Trichinella pseudospiralis]|uniref:Uncharacterized protein n=1 Tax=Trichinella pseudospiralis TaxID=6337 RepID=A0A0V1JQU6_TRIPS|nr:hypothetical protein T4C_10015 [Trichinella pseudospiralis]
MDYTITQRRRDVSSCSVTIPPCPLVLCDRSRCSYRLSIVDSVPCLIRQSGWHPPPAFCFLGSICFTATKTWLLILANFIPTIATGMGLDQGADVGPYKIPAFDPYNRVLTLEPLNVWLITISMTQALVTVSSASLAASKRIAKSLIDQHPAFQSVNRTHYKWNTTVHFMCLGIWRVSGNPW